MSRLLRSTLIAAAALVVLIAVALVARDQFGDDDAPTGQDATGAAAGGEGEGQSGAPAPDVPAPPAEMAAVGSWVRSVIDQSGDVEVQQWIRSATPVSRLQLTTADPDAFPGTVESSSVVATTFDGARLAARGAVGTRTSNVRLREPATEIYLTYEIDGATLSEETSTVAGRSVARVLAMDVAFEDQRGPTVRVVENAAGSVSNAGCLDPAAGYDAPPRACGAPTEDGGWQVELRGADRDDRLLAQLMS